MLQLKKETVGVSPGTTTLFIPYVTTSDLKEGNLGLIDPTEYWWTGRTWPHGPPYYPNEHWPSASKSNWPGYSLNGANLGDVVPQGYTQVPSWLSQYFLPIAAGAAVLVGALGYKLGKRG